MPSPLPKLGGDVTGANVASTSHIASAYVHAEHTWHRNKSNNTAMEMTAIMLDALTKGNAPTTTGPATHQRLVQLMGIDKV